MRTIALMTSLISLVLAGGIAGFFYAYSVSVMPGLDDAAPQVAIEAMQGINRVVRNPAFFVTFFLTPAVTALAAVFQFRARRRGAAGAMLLAVLVYLAGAFVPTLVVNVPMNEALADIKGGDVVAGAGAIWADFSPRWTAWNDLRTAASAVSLLLIGLAIALAGAARRGETTASRRP